MRSFAVALLCALPCAPAVFGQEPEPSGTPAPPAIDILPIRVIDPSTSTVLGSAQRDVWKWAPHLTLQYGKTTDGHFTSRYWYRIQDRRTDVAKATTLAADLSAGQWSLSGSVTRVPDRPDVRGSALGLNLIVPVRFLGVSPGLGVRYQTGKDATGLFSSGGTTIASSSSRQLVAAVLDVGVGRLDRSYLRVQGLYGNASLTDSLDLLIDGRIANSPLAQYQFAHSDFWGVGASGALRLYGVSFEGSVACYRPLRASVALPADECVVSGGGSVLVPAWLKFGSGVGVFARITHVSARRPPDHQTVQFLNDSFTYGITIRVP